MTEGNAEPVSYRPGSGTALVSGSCCVLLGPEVSRIAAIELWSALHGALSLEDIVEVVFEIGLRKLPTIAIAYRSATETHLLLRGRARGAVVGIDGLPEQILDSDARTWKEYAVRGRLSMYLGASSDAEDLPLSSGVVPADALTIGWEAPGRGVDAESAESDAVAQLPAPEDREGEVAGPVPSEDGPDSVSEKARGPELSVEPVVATQSAQVIEISKLTLAATEFEDSVGQSVPPPPDLSAESFAPGLQGSRKESFDSLFGVTRLPLSVEHAAVREDESEHDDVVLPSGNPPASDSDEPRAANGNSAPAAGLGIGGFLPPRARGPLGSVVQPPPAQDDRLIEGVPGAAPESISRATSGNSAPETEPVSHLTGEADDDEGTSMTITRSALRKTKDPGGSTGLGGVEQTVHAVFCDAGHPNPQAATACRVCSLPIEPADAVSMRRPVLGVLRFSNGIEVELDRPVIVGRAPKAERVSAREIPQLVALPSPEKDVSRNHMEVKLDGWHVIVVDLGSTNGTVVTLPGQAPERLRAQEEQLISPGTVVTIAEEFTFVYEVPR